MDNGQLTVKEAPASYQLSTVNSQLKVPPGYKQTEVGVIPEGWEVAPFSQFLEFRNGVNADRHAYGRGTPFINVLEVIKHTHILSSQIPGRVTLAKGVIDSYAVHRGDILFNRTSETQEEVGLASVYLGDEIVVFGGFVIRGRHQGRLLDAVFSGYAFRSPSIRSQIVSRGQGAVRANIGQQDLSQVLAVLPSLSEQRAIAAALSDVDALIAALDKLIAKKRAIKTAAMQQLLTGKQRLPGFSGAWEDRRLSDVANIQRGASPRPIDSPVWYDGKSKVGWIRISDITESDGKHLYKTRDYLSEKGIKASRFLPAGSLIMSIYATVGIPVVTQIDICIHDGFVGFSNLNGVDKTFLYYKLKELEPTFKGMGQTGSQSNLNSDLVRNCSVKLPDVVEQKAIASLLSDMDAEIAALEARRDKTQAIKQGMMQELLTGRIRLV